MSHDEKPEDLYPELEDRLRPLATPLEEPQVGDWLAEHREKGQTFRQYLAANPVRRDRDRTTIYLCLLGDFTGPQVRVLERTQEYLAIGGTAQGHRRGQQAADPKGVQTLLQVGHDHGVDGRDVGPQPPEIAVRVVGRG